MKYETWITFTDTLYVFFCQRTVNLRLVFLKVCNYESCFLHALLE
jgi:hypothetical protein